MQAMTSRASALKRKVKWLALGRAVRNPLKFRTEVKKLLALIRYIKYLAPIVVVGRKLARNLVNLRKCVKQRKAAKKQREIRQRRWEHAPLALKREYAAIVVQRIYRSYWARKAIRAMRMIRSTKYTLACFKVQRVFRRKLTEARARLQRKEEEYRRLRTEAGRGGTQASQWSSAKKRRMFKLQEELVAEARMVLNQKMLMRPNTQFAVVWRLLFVVCVTLEIVQLAARPLFGRGREKKGGAPRTMGTLIAEALMPVCTAEVPLPKAPPTENTGYCERPRSAAQAAWRDAVVLAFVPAPVSEWPECRREDALKASKSRKKKRAGLPPRWYCQENYARLHSVYRRVADFFLETFSIFVGGICFLDVPVTFFIGELHPENGVLVPKPFFARWLVPGLVLQLLVNPQMEVVSVWVIAVLRKALEHGPDRVYKWMKAVVFPLMFVALNLLVKCVWLPVVQVENKQLELPA